MARLHEYQGKAILAANGFKIPRGRAAATADEAVAIAKELAAGKKVAEVVIKIQAWTTGRAGIGGVAFAKKPDAVRGHAAPDHAPRALQNLTVNAIAPGFIHFGPGQGRPDEDYSVVVLMLMPLIVISLAFFGGVRLPSLGGPTGTIVTVRLFAS